MNLAKLKTMALGAFLRKCSEQTDPTLWIFSSKDNTQFNYNSKYLFLYVKEHCPELRPRYVMNDAAKRKELSARYGAEYFIDTTTIDGAKEALRAGVWFTSAGLPIYGSGLHKNRRIVNLWHGVPLKKIALHDPSLDTKARSYFRKIFSENYTDVVTTSQHLVPIMAGALGVDPSIVRVWGQPRNDMLFTENAWEFPKAEKIILYAPTFRSGKPVRLFPFPDFDMERLEAFLKERNYLLYLRTHLDESADASAFQSEHVRFLNEDVVEDVMEALPGVDLLITDYSSIFIDDLLLQRPLVFLPYDREEYEKNHGFYFDYDKVTEGCPKPETMEEFLDALEHASFASEHWNNFFNEVQEPCCGRICEEIKKSLNLN